VTPLEPVRRVVTGHGDRQVAKVLLDGATPNVRRGQSGSTIYHIWNTDRTPANIAAGEPIEDLGLRPGMPPAPSNGSRLVVVDYAPGNSGARHRTETIDYAIVLAGEIDMEMDESSVTLRAGDVVVQRGTYHTWWNRGSETARIAYVLIDAEPLGMGHPRTHNPEDPAQ
jgi:quercetin dioxygenase-like cupin family protein